MTTIDACIEFALKNIGLWWRYGISRHCDEWKYISIGRIFESEIILIPPSLKIFESSSNGSYRNTDEVWWRYGISRSCDEWVQNVSLRMTDRATGSDTWPRRGWGARCAHAQPEVVQYPYLEYIANISENTVGENHYWIIWGRCNLKRSRRTVFVLPVYKISSLKITPHKTPNSGYFSYPLPNIVSFLFEEKSTRVPV
jgi:hypothetical protein